MKHTAAEELRGIVAFVAIIWCTFFVSKVLPFPLNSLGITPRTLTGLSGIFAAPFLHANLGHLIGNSVPLFVLLTLLAGSRARSWEVVIEIVLLGGLLLWIVGRPVTHIGASGLIFGLIVFLIVSGILERRLLSLAVSAIVGFLYGGTILGGVMPRLGTTVSWDGHLCGAVAGGIVAYVLTRSQSRGSAGITASPSPDDS